jgi:predicted ATPase/DNA-binding SARP family transcriptional activator
MVKELRLTLFGSPQFSLGDTPLTGFVSTKAQALLCFLAITSRPHFRAELAGLLWGEKSEAVAAGNLRKALSNLNHLAGSHLTITRQTVAFDQASPHWLDVERFRSKLEAGPPSQGPDQWREAVELYQGDLLQGFYVRDAPAFEDWLTGERERLKTLAVGALQRLAAHYGTRRDPALGLEYARRLLALEPWREEAHQHMMRLLAQAGQRSAALAQYELCRRLLQSEFGAEPLPETVVLYQSIRAGAIAPPNNLPHLPSSIVGREIELGEIAQRLDRPDCRLLTLVGISGIGKTRLALEAATAQLADFPQGVFLAPLSPLRSANFLISTIAEAVGLTFYGEENPAKQLHSYLAEKRVLLVLDSFEHLLEGTGAVTELLARATDLKILVTSTQRLNVRGEWVLPVEALSVPPAAGPDPAVETYSAVQLYLQRAQRLGHAAAHGVAEIRSIADICRLVEGMPLAIELAAAWARVVPARDIALEIKQNRDFLATAERDSPERHRSMRAVFDYSWSLLAPAEKEAFTRLAVFRNGFERAAAEAVADAALPILSALVEKSLLTGDAAGRYHIHDLLRRYAAEKLTQNHLEERIRHRHLDFYLRLAEETDPQLHGPDQIVLLERLEAEHDNLRAALEWGLSAAPSGSLAATAATLRLAGSLGLFWDLRGHFSEGRQWLEQALALEAPLAPGRAWQAARSQALFWAGQLAKWQGHYPRAAELAQANLALSQGLGDQWCLAYALYLAGSVANKQGKLDGAKAYLAESVRLFQQVQGRWGLAHALGTLGNIAKARGDYAQAKAHWEESYALYRALGDRRGLARTLNRLWHLPFLDGDYARAGALLREAEGLFRELKHRDGVAIILRHLGLVAQAQGSLQAARELYEESRAIFRELADNDDLVYSTWYLGRLELYEGNLELALNLLEAARALAQEVGIKGLIARVSQTLAAVARQQGNYEAAQKLLEQALALALESGEPEVLVEALHEKAMLAAAVGELDHAARRFGAAEALREAQPVSLPVVGRAEYEQQVTMVRRQLGEAAFTALWAEGRTMPMATVVGQAAEAGQAAPRQ